MKRGESLSSVSVALAVLFIGIVGCSKPTNENAVAGAPLKPKEAATQLQQAFEQAPQEVRQTVAAASDALQRADYEGAVQSIQMIKIRPDLSLSQGVAIHASEVALESRLIAAMQAGDPKAKQAYERLKRFRRN